MEVAILIKSIVAFVCVISLMLLFAWILKRTGVAKNLVSAAVNKRLKIVEFLPIDHSHRLVIIKRDDKEHLLLLSSNGDTVIEKDIQFKDSCSGVSKDD